jgi:hypothetical protein
MVFLTNENLRKSRPIHNNSVSLWSDYTRCIMESSQRSVGWKPFGVPFHPLSELLFHRKCEQIFFAPYAKLEAFYSIIVELVSIEYFISFDLLNVFSLAITCLFMQRFKSLFMTSELCFFSRHWCPRDWKFGKANNIIQTQSCLSTKQDSYKVT